MSGSTRFGLGSAQVRNGGSTFGDKAPHQQLLFSWHLINWHLSVLGMAVVCKRRVCFFKKNVLAHAKE